MANAAWNRQEIEPGTSFGSWMTVGNIDWENPSGKYRYAVWCICTCGEFSKVRISHLRQGVTKGCSKCKGHRNFKHGMLGSKVYYTWQSMLNRCGYHIRGHKDYAGRGIKVCERWLSFENFLADMGEPPSKKHSLDRVNNDKGYGPDNCRWATRQEQMNNTRRNIKVTWNGRTQTAKQWALELGISYKTLCYRLKKGWTMDEAVSRPLFWRPKTKG